MLEEFQHNKLYLIADTFDFKVLHCIIDQKENSVLFGEVKLDLVSPGTYFPLEHFSLTGCKVFRLSAYLGEI